jgi:hypothetical protein
MTYLLLILKLFGGLILLFGLGYLIGYLLKSDIYFEDMRMHKIEDIQRYNNEDDQNYT